MRFAAFLISALAVMSAPTFAQDDAGNTTVVASARKLSAAERRAEELDKLFAKLHDGKAGSAATSTEQRIWELWMKSDSVTADLILSQATAAMGAADYKVSEEMLDQLIATNKSYTEAYNKRATLYFLTGRLDKSLEDIQTVLDQEPRHFGALAGRAMIYVKQGKLQNALKAYREADAINPNTPGISAAIKQLQIMAPDI